MASDRIDRFKKRKEILNKTETNRIYLVPDEKLVNDIISQSSDNGLFEQIEHSQNQRYSLDLPDEGFNSDQAAILLEEIKAKYNEDKFDLLISSCKENVIGNIIKPFGLAHVFFDKSDKTGGNVTTPHNASEGVYAKKSEEYQRLEYEKNFKGSYGMRNQIVNDRMVDGKSVDEYTGKNIDNPEGDHIIALDTFHKRGGYMLTLEERAAFGADPRNIAVTDGSINASKGKSEMKEWQSHIAKGQTKPNKERFEVDNRRVNPREAKAEEAAKEYLLSAKGKTIYMGKEIASTGLQEGARFGFQQALGVVLLELVQGIFDETKYIYNICFKEKSNQESLAALIKERLKTIKDRVLARYKDIVDAFEKGLISGFISNIVTTIVNCFITTAKNYVRMIREGFFSILQAIKMLVSPPSGFTLKQAAHEAVKILVGGITIAGGILVEEAVSTAIKSIPLLAPLSSVLSTVIVGTVTGLLAALLVYSIDKIDLLGVERERQHEYVMAILQTKIDMAMNEAREAFNVFALPEYIS